MRSIACACASAAARVSTGRAFWFPAVSGTLPINPVTEPLIELRNVTVMRGANIALRNLSLTIGAGEHVAILGPNGCGKSTLIKTITRECYPLARPDSSVRILGRSLWNVFDLRSMLGIVSNDLMTQCTREITGFDVVLSGFFSSIGIWPNHHVTDEMRQKANDVLRLLEAPHLAQKPVDEMSSGEARRMLIGRVLWCTDLWLCCWTSLRPVSICSLSMSCAKWFVSWRDRVSGFCW